MPNGRVVVAIDPNPVNTQPAWLMEDRMTGEVPILVVPAKKSMVPVAGFPQLVPVRSELTGTEDPSRAGLWTDGLDRVVIAGVMVTAVEPAGPALKLASPL